MSNVGFMAKGPFSLLLSVLLSLFPGTPTEQMKYEQEIRDEAYSCYEGGEEESLNRIQQYIKEGQSAKGCDILFFIEENIYPEDKSLAYNILPKMDSPIIAKLFETVQQRAYFPTQDETVLFAVLSLSVMNEEKVISILNDLDKIGEAYFIVEIVKKTRVMQFGGNSPMKNIDKIVDSLPDELRRKIKVYL